MLNGIGEVFTYRKQDTINSGYGVYDPSKVFYAEDPEGKVSIDGVRSRITKEPTPVDPTLVVIGGKDYHFVEWCGLKVLTEDLTWDVGTYYINPNAPEPIGYYYASSTANVSAIHVALRNAGLGEWRIPKAADWTKLINEPTITLPTSEKYEHNRGITRLLTDAAQFSSVFPTHTLLNESGIGLNPCRIATTTTFDRANYLEDSDGAHNVIMRYDGGYTVVTANYAAASGACVRLVADI